MAQETIQRRGGLRDTQWWRAIPWRENKREPEIVLCNQRGLGNCASVKIKNIDTCNGGSEGLVGGRDILEGIEGAREDGHTHTRCEQFLPKPHFVYVT